MNATLFEIVCWVPTFPLLINRFLFSTFRCTLCDSSINSCCLSMNLMKILFVFWKRYPLIGNFNWNMSRLLRIESLFGLFSLFWLPVPFDTLILSVTNFTTIQRKNITDKWRINVESIVEADPHLPLRPRLFRINGWFWRISLLYCCPIPLEFCTVM